jgi:hypothetical protein
MPKFVQTKLSTGGWKENFPEKITICILPDI